MGQAETINVNLHGHVLSKNYSDFWRKHHGVLGKNLAGILVDICIERNLDIYAITDDSFGNIGGVSRFDQIKEEVRKLPKEIYEVDELGNNAIRISKYGVGVFLIDGQSLTVYENDRKYELLTFGRSGIDEFNSFDEAKEYLNGEGLLSIAEHPLADGHHGSMGEKLEELCSDKRIDAVEHNGKIAVPNFFNWVPIFKGFTKERNEEGVKIARKYGIPVIANDDSDKFAQIGSAYSIFPRNKIKFNNGESLVESIGNVIREYDFEIHNGYTKFFPDWIKWAVWDVAIIEGVLELRDTYLEKYK